MPQTLRLDKYVAEATGCTRSESRARIAAGRVAVDGAVCRKADAKVGEGQTVALDGVPLGREQFVYLMLHKPAGVVSASRDGRDTTVVDLAAAAYPRRQLFPAGRLDKTSTGFVLLTDDGAFAHHILSPRHHVEKVYTVTLDTPLTAEMAAGFAAGVTLADGETLAPAAVRTLSPDGRTVRVTLRQGVYHQIKRMFGVYGAGVNALHRDAIQTATLTAALRSAALSLSNAIRSGSLRPREAGTAAQAPIVTTIDYRKATPEQREAIRRRIQEGWARGENINPF